MITAWGDQYAVLICLIACITAMSSITKESDHSIDFLDYFKDLKDPCQIDKSTYPLDEILLLVLCAVLSGADDWVAIALYGEEKHEFLKNFRPFVTTPSR